jgi:hypothetical protein
MAKAQATILWYPKTYLRPPRAIRDDIPSEGGLKPSDSIEWVWDQANHPQVLLGRVTGPLVDSYLMELEPRSDCPITAHSRHHARCPPRVAWHFPSSSLRKGDKEAYHQKFKAFLDRPLTLCKGSGLPLHPCCGRIVGNSSDPMQRLEGFLCTHATVS